MVPDLQSNLLIVSVAVAGCPNQLENMRANISDLRRESNKQVLDIDEFHLGVRLDYGVFRGIGPELNGLESQASFGLH